MGYGVLDFGFWVLCLGFWVLGLGFWVSGFGFGVLVFVFFGFGFLVLGFGFRMLGSGWECLCTHVCGKPLDSSMRKLLHNAPEIATQFLDTQSLHNIRHDRLRVPGGAKMLKGHLPRVIYHQVY